MSEDELALFRGATTGIVFQSFHLVPTMTALENVALPLEFAGASDAFAVARELLHEVGLTARLDHFPAELSGGEQQRVAIARAVANVPRLLLADEPTGNLDPKTSDHVFRALSQLIRESGLTVVLATHNMEIAARMDRRVTIRDGRIVELA
jgi:predicted ABC-type transport system involved in lysophospholipase L1 biosynthesis ATPase subunit